MAVQSLKQSSISNIKKYDSLLAGNAGYDPYPVVSGGTLYSDATYYYRAFTSSGNLTLTGGMGNSLVVDALVIGGGAAGGRTITAGYQAGGGGGAGVVVLGTNIAASQAYPNVITIGAGGSYNSSVGSINSATASSFATIGQTITAAAGGNPGWSSQICCPQTVYAEATLGGGAGGFNLVAKSGAVGTGGTGGNTTFSGSRNSGGGGGAGNGNNGQIGQLASTNAASSGGAGGNGTSAYSSWLAACNLGQDVSGTRYIGGGGGGGMSIYNSGGTWYSTATPASGGYGGGGYGLGQIGEYSITIQPAAGTANTGGGGGGGGFYATAATTTVATGANASGGSGLVIIRYPRASVGG